MIRGGGSSCSKGGRKKYARSIMEHKFVGEEGEKTASPHPFPIMLHVGKNKRKHFFVFGARKFYASKEIG